MLYTGSIYGTIIGVVCSIFVSIMLIIIIVREAEAQRGCVGHVASKLWE